MRPDPAVHRDDWEAAWKADLKLLDETHATLRAAVEDLTPDELASRAAGVQADATPSRSTASRCTTSTTPGRCRLIKRLAGSGEE